MVAKWLLVFSGWLSRMLLYICYGDMLVARVLLHGCLTVLGDCQASGV